MSADTVIAQPGSRITRTAVGPHVLDRREKRVYAAYIPGTVSCLPIAFRPRTHRVDSGHSFQSGLSAVITHERTKRTRNSSDSVRALDPSVLRPDTCLFPTEACGAATFTADNDFIPKPWPGTTVWRECQMALDNRGSAMSAIPEAYWEMIAPLIERARVLLEDGESLLPIAFVGSPEKRTIGTVVLSTADGDVQGKSVEQVRRAAYREDADFVFTVMEAWGLPPDKVGKYQAILDRYGSIEASPYAVDLVSFALETRDGSWVAQVQVQPKGISKRKKTFGEPRFRLFPESGGGFAQLLPQRVERSDGGGAMH